MDTATTLHSGKCISILIIDDSLVFRKFLRDNCIGSPHLQVVGEGRNGIEALDLVLKLKPDVILMDMEMPLMDGMTALQHLMIHRPTPTIMFSSLSNEGTARAFDALKNGAVDFVCKDFIFMEKNLEVYSQKIIHKIENAARVKVSTIDPIFTASQDKYKQVAVEKHIVFCEECGEKQFVEMENGQIPAQVQCGKCGDMTDLSSFSRSRRNTFMTVMAGGEGCYRNLLNIVPLLDIEMEGSILIVIYAEAKEIDSFTEYLASVSNVRVLRARDGERVEGGMCYISSASETFVLRQLGSYHVLQKVKAEGQLGPVDLAMASVVQVFKHKSAGIILSGAVRDGVMGLEYMRKNNGYSFVLSPDVCFCDELPLAGQEKFKATSIDTESELVETIRKIHSTA